MVRPVRLTSVNLAGRRKHLLCHGVRLLARGHGARFGGAGAPDGPVSNNTIAKTRS